MKKYLLLVGNFTFHHFEKKELELFNTKSESKALAHEVDSVLLFENKELAYARGDEAESYVIFPYFSGELVFESDEVRLQVLKEVSALIPIEFVKEYSESLFIALKL